MNNNKSSQPDWTSDFWEDLQSAPYKHSFYQVLRSLDAQCQMPKPLGRNSQPAHEPVRLKQEPAMAFAPSTLHSAEREPGSGKWTISQLAFGLFGPNGPLPLHLTEYTRERVYHHKDHTLSAFADIFHHRLTSLFYRAWADAQSTVNLEIKGEPFTRYVASLIGIGFDSQRGQDSINDYAKLYFSGHLSRQTRNPEGLLQILRSCFRVPVRMQEYVPQWVKVPESQQFSLNGECGVGSFAVIGSRVRDVQHKFRLLLGPMSRKEYLDFLPGSQKSQALVDWVRTYSGYEYAWDVCLVLKNEEISGIKLGDRNGLGLSSFLGKNKNNREDFKELKLDYEGRL